METNLHIVVYYCSIFFFIIPFSRIFWQSFPVLQRYYYEEDYDWNPKLNPYKLRIYFFFFIAFILLLLYHKFCVSKNLIDIIPSIFTYIAFYVLLEFKIQSKTKNYIQNSNTAKLSINIDQELKPILLNSDESQFNKVIDKSNANLRCLKNRQINPFSISDEDIKEKFLKLKNEYNLFCNEMDFINMLKGDSVNEKILFLDKNNIELQCTINEYLAIINFIVNENLEEFKSNTKIINWIHNNFNLGKIKTTKLSSKNISDFKYDIKIQKKSNLK